MVPPADHRLNPSSASSTFFHGGSLLRCSAINNNLSSAGGAETKSLEDVGSVYKFTRVFGDLPTTAIGLPTSNPSIPSAVSQADFFLETALPLVHDFLAGQNCLLFAYGPTGSGKTWTVQGGEGENAGLLPRVMDVVWRSLQGKESKSNVSPIRLLLPSQYNF
jgi:kinesin family protein 20